MVREMLEIYVQFALFVMSSWLCTSGDEAPTSFGSDFLNGSSLPFSSVSMLVSFCGVPWMMQIAVCKFKYHHAHLVLSSSCLCGCWLY
jgi:hypothetical protein